MKRIIAAAAVAVAIAGCSGPGGDGDGRDAGRDRAVSGTDRTAERIEKKIRTPLDRARATRSLGDRRLEEMDRAVRDSDRASP